MNRVPLSIPEIAIIGGTRAALGLGIGLLIADSIGREKRRGIGWALLGMGVVSTVPIVMQLIAGRSKKALEGQAADGNASADEPSYGAPGWQPRAALDAPGAEQ